MKLFTFMKFAPRLQAFLINHNSGVSMRSILVNFEANSFMNQHYNFPSMSNLSNDFIYKINLEGETALNF